MVPRIPWGAERYCLWLLSHGATQRRHARDSDSWIAHRSIVSVNLSATLSAFEEAGTIMGEAINRVGSDTQGVGRMKRSGISAEQIIGILKEQEAGMATAEVCRRHGISPAAFYKWQSKFGGMEVSETRRLQALEDENAKLKKLLARRYWISRC